MEQVLYLKARQGMNSINRVVNLLKKRQFDVLNLSVDLEEGCCGWQVGIVLGSQDSALRAQGYLRRLIDVYDVEIKDGLLKKSA